MDIVMADLLVSLALQSHPSGPRAGVYPRLKGSVPRNAFVCKKILAYAFKLFDNPMVA
jgi:hypothetical protein